MSKPENPFSPILSKQGIVILDGGLATELERRGHDLNHRLWSARLLITDPGEIRNVHLAYLDAGADCIISASYQASIDGFVAEGVSEKKAQNLIKRTVALACEAREIHISQIESESNKRLPALVAASIGPYGAFLADGSEYHGNYNITSDQLRIFHESRWEVLTDTPADLFACETIPSIKEAEILLTLLQTTPDISAWISFSCKDSEHISDGTPIEEGVALFNHCDQVIAVGVNCTAPRHISHLINKIKHIAPITPVIVYPNSGEKYDALNKRWMGLSEPLHFGQAAREWMLGGASIIGGCCRTGPDHIASIRKALVAA
jgi:homocysteine S-methyltransferase